MGEQKVPQVSTVRGHEDSEGRWKKAGSGAQAKEQMPESEAVKSKSQRNA